MADIDVVKKGSSSWVWLLAILAAAVLVWLLWSSMRSDDTPGATGEMGRSEVSLPNAPGSNVIAA